MQEYPDFGDDVAKPQGTDLELLTGLAERLKEKTDEIAQAQTVVKALEAQARELAWNEIPELMENLGVSEFKLRDGSKITIKTDIRCSIPKDPEKRAEAMNWVSENGGEELIKRAFEITFDRHQGDEAKAFEAKLQSPDNKLDYERHETLATGSLKVWIANKLEAGEQVPMEKLGAFRQTIAKVK